MPGCLAPNCKNKRGEGVSFFQIPDAKRNPARREIAQKWLQRLRIDTPLDDFTFGHHKIVCEFHFEPWCLDTEHTRKVIALGQQIRKKSLVPNAYPSVFENIRQVTPRDRPLRKQKRSRPGSSSHSRSRTESSDSGDSLTPETSLSPSGSNCSTPLKYRQAKSAGASNRTPTAMGSQLPPAGSSFGTGGGHVGPSSAAGSLLLSPIPLPSQQCGSLMAEFSKVSGFVPSDSGMLPLKTEPGAFVSTTTPGSSTGVRFPTPVSGVMFPTMAGMSLPGNPLSRNQQLGNTQISYMDPSLMSFPPGTAMIQTGLPASSGSLDLSSGALQNAVMIQAPGNGASMPVLVLPTSMGTCNVPFSSLGGVAGNVAFPHFAGVAPYAVGSNGTILSSSVGGGISLGPLGAINLGSAIDLGGGNKGNAMVGSAVVLDGKALSSVGGVAEGHMGGNVRSVATAVTTMSTSFSPPVAPGSLWMGTSGVDTKPAAISHGRKIAPKEDILATAAAVVVGPRPGGSSSAGSAPRGSLGAPSGYAGPVGGAALTHEQFFGMPTGLWSGAVDYGNHTGGQSSSGVGQSSSGVGQSSSGGGQSSSSGLTTVSKKYTKVADVAVRTQVVNEANHLCDSAEGCTGSSSRKKRSSHGTFTFLHVLRVDGYPAVVDANSIKVVFYLNTGSFILGSAEMLAALTNAAANISTVLGGASVTGLALFEPTTSPPTATAPEALGWWIWLIVGLGAVLIIIIIVVVVLYLKNAKNRGKVSQGNRDEEELAPVRGASASPTRTGELARGDGVTTSKQ